MTEVPQTQFNSQPAACDAVLTQALSLLKDQALFCLTDSGEVVQCINDCSHLLGYNEKETTKTLFSTLLLVGDENRDQFRLLLDSAAKANSSGIFRLHRKDGSQTQVKLTVSLTSNHLDPSVRYLLLIEKIGEVEKPQLQGARVNSNESLLRSNFDLMQFAYVASHDLQEPLRTVIGFCDLLMAKNKGKLDADSERYVNIMTANARRMQQMISDLLLYAKLDAPNISTSAVNLARPLAQAIFALDSAITASGAQISHDELPTITGNSTQLSLLFQNLLANAIKFRTADPPTIHISCQTSDDRHQISITDKGIGLDMNDTEKIFMLLQRLHPKDVYEGNGIGLAVCRRIAQRHDATITVDSELGKGSTFTISFAAILP